MIFEKSIFDDQNDILGAKKDKKYMFHKISFLSFFAPKISFWSSKMDYSKIVFRSPYDLF